ncbi:MAG TPA: hypothetical protein VFV23_10485 [Verrucomicrobiae bacterium]|nr:hypothetical protein [Verrucomicrobiae bacterium]
MTLFRYWRDPLFLGGCFAYAINRWLIKPHFHHGFFHSHFDDFWLIPCALPPVLWLHRKMALRSNDAPPKLSEIIFHLVSWSLLFEWIGPRFVSHTTSDPGDVVAYAAGALLAGLWWSRDRWFLRSRA